MLCSETKPTYVLSVRSIVTLEENDLLTTCRDSNCKSRTTSNIFSLLPYYISKKSICPIHAIPLLLYIVIPIVLQM